MLAMQGALLAAMSVLCGLTGAAAQDPPVNASLVCSFDAVTLPANTSVAVGNASSKACLPGMDVMASESCVIVMADGSDCATITCRLDAAAGEALWSEEEPTCPDDDTAPYEGIAVIAVITPLLTVLACGVALRIKERQLLNQEQ